MRQDSEFRFEFVDTPSGLTFVIKALEGVDTIAVDLEADSMFHFQEKVCLIQIASSRHLFIVDPIQVRDLSALKPLFGNHRIKS